MPKAKIERVGRKWFVIVDSALLTSKSKKAAIKSAVKRASRDGHYYYVAKIVKVAQ